MIRDSDNYYRGNVRVVSDDELDLFNAEFPQYSRAILQVIIAARLNNTSLREIQQETLEEANNDLQVAAERSEHDSEGPSTGVIYQNLIERLIAIDLCRKLGYCDAIEDSHDPLETGRRLEEFERQHAPSPEVKAMIDYVSKLWDQVHEK